MSRLFGISAGLFLIGTLLAFDDSNMAPINSENAKKTSRQRLEEMVGPLSRQRSTPASTVSTAVFAIAHQLRIPDSVRNLLTDKFAAAEEGYWNGTNNGVRESDLVTTVNQVVDRLQLPEYAKTNQAQLRSLRIQLLQMTPNFLGRGMFRSTPDGKRQISESLSPLQAFYLIQSLVDQKFSDVSYQVPPSEWHSTWAESERARRAAIQPGVTRNKASLGTLSDTKYQELQERLQTSLNSTSALAGAQIIQQALSTFHVSISATEVLLP